MASSFIQRIPMRTLVYGMAGGGIAVSAMGLYMQRDRSTKLARQPYYRTAVKMLKENEGAKKLLGEPIVDKRVDLPDQKHNILERGHVRLRIPVWGPKGEGGLDIDATQSEETLLWSLNQALLEVTETTELVPTEYHGKKMYIYDSERHGPLPAQEAKH